MRELVPTGEKVCDIAGRLTATRVSFLLWGFDQFAVEHTEGRTLCVRPERDPKKVIRFCMTILSEFSGNVRKKIYEGINRVQTDLNAWIAHHNYAQIHQGDMCSGRTDGNVH